jgi:hypothetical protein
LLQEKNCFHNFFIKKEPANEKLSKKNDDKFLETKPHTDGVWLKYKEGFINAVRYNVKISDLL